MYTQYHDAGFEILGISQDQEAEHWAGAIEQDHLPWPQARDVSGEISNLYLISSLPSNILVGPDGRIVLKNVQASEISAYLKAHLR